ncbi:MAG: hypothetical protein Q9225_002619 [Loekoesia sp. 1 TL-2023]
MPATFIRRAVSPVHFEPVQGDPDDILCPGSDAEETPEAHRDKRRRVEEAAKEYLRGKSLYIASARLRGPFPSHWKNPYATKKTQDGAVSRGTRNASQRSQAPFERDREVALQIRDSAAQTTAQQPEVTIDTSAPRRHRERSVKHAGHISDFIRIQPTFGEEAGVTQDSFVTATSEASKEIGQVKPAEFSNSNAHEWLRTNRLSTKQKFKAGPRSPTPTPASRPPRQAPKHVASDGPEAVNERYSRDTSPVASALEERHTRQPSLTGVASPVSKPAAIRDIPNPESRNDKQLLHALPPSTNLSGFEYRYSSRNTSPSPQGKSFKEDLEAAKKRARAEEKRRLSFTASGNIKKRRSQTSSRGCQSLNSGQMKSPPGLPQGGISEGSPLENKQRAFKPGLKPDEGSTSNQEALPEAQIVQKPGLGNAPSVPSTELLETEKQSLKFRSTDEGDLYHGLSTQAAMLQAQRSLQHDIASLIASPGIHVHGAYTVNEHDRRVSRDEDHLKLAGAPGSELPLPAANDEEPMSTQAMLDAVSPFVVTTVKKRPPAEKEIGLAGSASGSSPPLSPNIRDFRANSLSMSTTPSDSPAPANNGPPIPLSALSKPTSTITSFSIAPNGTMTEVMQYDGQQQQNYHMGDSDLDAALEEAGSFLGDWSVEKEAKQLQRSTAGSKTSSAKAPML